MPRLSDSMEAGTILQWLVAAGDSVAVGQPLVEIETDKATVVYEADTAGVIVSLDAGAGDSVRVGGVIAMLGAAGEQAPAATPVAASAVTATAAAAPRAAPPPSPAAAPPTASAPPAAGSPPSPLSPSGPPAPSGRPRASPLARRLARELGVELVGLAGSGPEGRVIKADVELLAAAGNGARVAARAHVELRVEVDMSEPVELCERAAGASDPAPTPDDLIVKAVAVALRGFPALRGDGPGINIAVVTGDQTTTISDADRKRLREIAAAPAGGGTAPFAIYNLGRYEIDGVSPVIGPGQIAVLGVGSLRRRLIADEPAPRPTIHLSLACNQAVEGAGFLARVRELLEHPLSMLL
jgi:pyruvate dehydrogenase E2 component (dihydrolipoamide acetyltransferase)